MSRTSHAASHALGGCFRGLTRGATSSFISNLDFFFPKVILFLGFTLMVHNTTTACSVVLPKVTLKPHCRMAALVLPYSIPSPEVTEICKNSPKRKKEQILSEGHQKTRSLQKTTRNRTPFLLCRVRIMSAVKNAFLVTGNYGLNKPFFFFFLLDL